MTDRLRHYFLPGEDRAHFAAFVNGVQVTKWSVDREDATRNIIGARVRCEIRPWEISAVEWSRTDEARMFRRWELHLTRRDDGVSLEPVKRRAIL